MSNAILVALVAGAAATASHVLVRLIRPTLLRYAIANPTARSSHVLPTPQGAGTAVIAATLLVSIAVFASMGAESQVIPQLAAVAIAVGLLALIGLVDDLRGLAPRLRFVAQFVLVLLVLVSLPDSSRLMPQVPILIERAIVLVGVVWFVNLYNFMDGLDWMTVAETVPIATAIAVIGVMGLLPLSATIVAGTLAGAMLGFAPFNRPVATLFLGDAGSLAIGLLVAWLLIMLAMAGHWAAALLLPLYYLADSGLTLARRAARREPLWQAHRSHYYQIATVRGLSVPAVVGRVFAVNVALVILALITVQYGSVPVLVIVLAVGAAIVGWLLLDLSRVRA